MFTKDIGIDLGTANTLVYMKGRGIIMREPSVVAVDPLSDELRVRSVGHEAMPSSMCVSWLSVSYSVCWQVV